MRRVSVHCMRRSGDTVRASDTLTYTASGNHVCAGDDDARGEGTRDSFANSWVPSEPPVSSRAKTCPRALARARALARSRFRFTRVQRRVTRTRKRWKETRRETSSARGWPSRSENLKKNHSCTDDPLENSQWEVSEWEFRRV